MHTRAKQLVQLLLRLSVAVVLLVWVFSKVDLSRFRETVAAARWQYLIGVWGSTALFSWVQSVALQWILKKQECEVSTNLIFGATCVTSLYGLVLPGFVTTGVKWYILKRTTGRGTNVLSAMLYNQVTLTVVMTVVGLVGLIVVNPTRALWPESRRLWILPVVCAVVLAVIVVLSVLALNTRTGGPVVGLLSAALKPLPQSVQEKGRTLLMQIATFQSAGWRFHLAVGSINVVAALPAGWLWYLFAAWAASVVVPTSVLIWLCAIVFVLGKIPISIANLGVREVTLVVMLAGYGVSEPAALLMSMILFSSLVFLAALGVVYQLVWTLPSRQTTPPA